MLLYLLLCAPLYIRPRQLYWWSKGHLGLSLSLPCGLLSCSATSHGLHVGVLLHLDSGGLYLGHVRVHGRLIRFQPLHLGLICRIPNGLCNNPSFLYSSRFSMFQECFPRPFKSMVLIYAPKSRFPFLNIGLST